MIFKKFTDLVRSKVSLTPQSYATTSIEQYSTHNLHRVGVNSLDQICILIDTLPDAKGYKTHRSYKNVEIHFSKECTVINEDGFKENKVFTVLILLSHNQRFIEYFSSICDSLLFNLGDHRNEKRVFQEIMNILEIFDYSSNVRNRSEQGLFAEMLFLSICEDLDYAVQAWHAEKNSLVDFTTNRVVLEVKSTMSSHRKHTISQKQLVYLNDNSGLLISIILQESDLGTSVIDLAESLKSKSKNSLLHRKIDKFLVSSIFSTEDTENIRKYDLASALRSMRLFHSSKIEPIEKKSIPSHIENIDYTINIENIESRNIEVFNFSNSE